MFKDAPKGLHAEAWRILMAVVNGKELLPNHVREYMKKSVARHAMEDAPGSASAATSPSAPAPSTYCAAGSGSQAISDAAMSADAGIHFRQLVRSSATATQAQGSRAAAVRAGERRMIGVEACA